MEGIFSRIFKQSDLVVALGLIGTLMFMVVPVPVFLIDLSLVLAIGGSVVLLLTSIYTVRTLDFAVFPSVLLMATLFRLALNVATTRVILLHGGELGVSSAGRVIESFGRFIVGGNYAVGLVIFSILVIINFVVITKGAGRIAEVSARFTLDALPGRQMAIDSDLSTGSIREEEARHRRLELAQEADFYGAMDGASKFVRGDAIAGVLIVLINLIGGILVGTLQKGMSLSEAAEVFALLTVGDGLVSQIPALVISVAAGIFVSRTSRGSHLGEELTQQVFRHPKALFVSSIFLTLIGLLPGMPFFPFLVIAAVLSGVGIFRSSKSTLMRNGPTTALAVEEIKRPEKTLRDLISVYPLEIQMGHGLLRLVSPSEDGPLNQRLESVRRQLALDLGFVIPSIAIRDNLDLGSYGYRFLFNGITLTEWAGVAGHVLAIDPGAVEDLLEGIPVKEPAYGFDALWIPSGKKEEALKLGYTVIDHAGLISTHFSELIRRNAHELFGRQELEASLSSLRQTSSSLVEDLIPNILSLSIVLRVLKNLLKEGVSIRDLRTILETLAEFGTTTKDPDSLTEVVRKSLARVITSSLVGQDGKLGLFTLESDLEEILVDGLVRKDGSLEISVDPEFIQSFVADLKSKLQLVTDGSPQVLLCSPRIRADLKEILGRFVPEIFVISPQEILPSTIVRRLGTVRLANGT